MRRRSFLLGLLAAPFAPLAAKLAPKAVPGPTLLDVARRGDPGAHMFPVVECLAQRNVVLGSDQTSIWLVDVRQMPATHEHPIIKDLLYGIPVPKGQVNWLKRSLRG